MTKERARANSLATSCNINSIDPVLSIYDQWLDVTHKLREALLVGDDETPAVKKLDFKCDQIVEQLANTQPTTLAGVAAISHVFWETFGPDSDPISRPAEYAKEAATPEMRLIKMLWRAGSGQAEFPHGYARHI